MAFRIGRGAWIAVLLCAVSLLMASIGDSAYGGEPSAADRETARTLMAQGRARRDKKDLKAALESFQAADTLVHAPTTALELGKTQMALGMLLEAKDSFMRVVRSQQPGESEPFKKARKEAETYIPQLDERIPAARLQLKGVPADRAATVQIDSIDVPATSLVAPRRLNPGHHTTTATVGAADRKQQFDLAEKETKDVVLDFTGADFGPGPSQGGAGPEPTTQPVPSGTETPVNPPKSYTLAYVGFSVAAAGLILGGVTGGLALSHKNNATPSCDGNRCPPSVHDEVDSAKSMATISTIGFVVGGVGAAVGLAGLIWPSSASASTQSARARIHPVLYPTGAGVVGCF